MGRLVLVAVLVASITVGHYTLSPVHAGIHDLMQRLYYVPIVLAGFWFGLRGGLVTAATISALYVPHIFMQWGGLHAGNVEKFLELILFFAVGVITGLLAERLRSANQRLVHAYDSMREKTHQLLQAEEKLGSAQRLAALGELSAELAHEIRNPLGSIKVSAEIFRDRIPADDSLREFATILCKETDRLDEVLRGCLQMARKSDAAEDCGDLAEAAREVVQLVTAQANQAGVKVALVVADDLPRVRASQTSLRQVLLNLAYNAIQAMAAGGRLSIEARAEGERVSVRVSDTGPGIQPQDREQVFQPFFSRREGGTGLGLAISRRLIAGAGGSIDFESEPGRGTVFTIDLPASAREG